MDFICLDLITQLSKLLFHARVNKDIIMDGVMCEKRNPGAWGAAKLSGFAAWFCFAWIPRAMNFTHRFQSWLNLLNTSDMKRKRTWILIHAIFQIYWEKVNYGVDNHNFAFPGMIFSHDLWNEFCLYTLCNVFQTTGFSLYNCWSTLSAILSLGPGGGGWGWGVQKGLRALKS